MASKTSELSYLGIFIQCVGCITAIIELSHGSFEKQQGVFDLKCTVLCGGGGTTGNEAEARSPRILYMLCHGFWILS